MIQSRWTLPLLRRASWSFRSGFSISPLATATAKPGPRKSPSRHLHSLENSGCIFTTMNTSSWTKCHYARHQLASSFSGHESLMMSILQSRCFNSSPTLYAPKPKKKKSSPPTKKKSNNNNNNNNNKQTKTKSKQSHGKKNEQKKKTPQQPRWLRDPVEQMHKTEKKEVPRAFLAPTASRHAYIARCAVMDESTGEVYVDPKSLFSELNNNNSSNSNITSRQGVGNKSNNQSQSSSQQQQQRNSSRKTLHQLPRIFRNSYFEYFPPSSFPNFEPPRDGTPEVAFLGRSNTGKSSLINAISSSLSQRGGGTATRHIASGGGELARTSKKPGRTQTINYFGLVPNDAEQIAASTLGQQHVSANQSKLYLVDLPGFGYAAAPDESVDEWQKKTQQFLISRASSVEEEEVSQPIKEFGQLDNDDDEEDGDGAGGNQTQTKNRPIRQFGQHDTSPPLKRLYLLMDSRLDEPPRMDLTVMGWCDDYAIPYTIVLTKVDRTSRANCVKLTNQMCMRFHSLAMDTSDDEEEEVYMDPVVYWTSAKDGLGMEELLLSVENNMFSSEEEVDMDHYEDDDDDDAEFEEDKTSSS